MNEPENIVVKALLMMNELEKIDDLDVEFDYGEDGEEGESGTLVAVLGNGFLVMGADSRGVSLAGETTTLDRMKVFHIFGKVFAIATGNSRDSHVILKKVKEQFDVVPPSSVKEIVNLIIRYANHFKPYLGMKYDFIVGGKLLISDKCQLFVVEKRQPDGFVAFESRDPCSLGSDKYFSKLYMKDYKHEISRSMNDPVRIAYQVRNALAYAVLQGKHSGGDLNVMTLEKDGSFVMYSSVREQKEKGGYTDIFVISDCQWSRIDDKEAEKLKKCGCCGLF